MNIDQFWSLIASARAEAGDRVHPQFPSRFLAALGARLDELTLQEVIDFDARRHELYQRANRPGLRAVNRMVDTEVGQLSQPSDAFLSGLVSLGRESFERALVDADSLYWEPILRAVAEDQLPANRLLLGDIAALAAEVYASRSDANGVFYRLVSARLYPEESTDEAYDDDEGGAEEGPWDDDSAQVQNRLPKLSAMFAARTAEAEQVMARTQRLGAVGWTVLFAVILLAAAVIALIGRALENRH
ncbi:hypothetical protein Rhe02_71950 [Rhizocola hellebori]|uniref:DUF4240 domain-containing protein n=1 Tax=Rhizocola hellebori TaxID=1392758 RepID=A0A8J3QGR1_9ACTN|nr:DUF4240 domain-containing protein [Rhizocola hellebori]GIH09128.1 hypothetical protein Rhe02_71950 [Rhizocola hellebori]